MSLLNQPQLSMRPQKVLVILRLNRHHVALPQHERQWKQFILCNEGMGSMSKEACLPEYQSLGIKLFRKQKEKKIVQIHKCKPACHLLYLKCMDFIQQNKTGICVGVMFTILRSLKQKNKIVNIFVCINTKLKLIYVY